MPAQPSVEFDNFDFTSFGEAAKALFSNAETPDEVAALRDEVIRRIAEDADAARTRIAPAAEQAPSGRKIGKPASTEDPSR